MHMLGQRIASPNIAEIWALLSVAQCIAIAASHNFLFFIYLGFQAFVLKILFLWRILGKIKLWCAIKTTEDFKVKFGTEITKIPLINVVSAFFLVPIIDFHQILRFPNYYKNCSKQISVIFDLPFNPLWRLLIEPAKKLSSNQFFLPS